MTPRQPMTLVYVAGSYRALTQAQVESNIDSARKMAGRLWAEGFTVVCPHTNTAHFDTLFPGIPDEAYRDGDIEILSRCDAVVAAPGWSESNGTLRELKYAVDHLIPVYFWPGRPSLRSPEDAPPIMGRTTQRDVQRAYEWALTITDEESARKWADTIPWYGEKWPDDTLPDEPVDPETVYDRKELGSVRGTVHTITGPNSFTIWDELDRVPVPCTITNMRLRLPVDKIHARVEVSGVIHWLVSEPRRRVVVFVDKMRDLPTGDSGALNKVMDGPPVDITGGVLSEE